MRTKKEKIGAVSVDASYVFLDRVTDDNIEDYINEDEETHSLFNLYLNEEGKKCIDTVLHFLKHDASADVFSISLWADWLGIAFSDPCTEEEERITGKWVEVYATGEIVAYIETDMERYGISVPYDALVEDLESD